MKKIIAISIFLLHFIIILNAQGVDTTGIDEWIIDNKSNTFILGNKITSYKPEKEGISVTFSKNKVEYSLLIMSKTSLSKIENSFNLFNNQILKKSDLSGGKRKIEFSSFEFVFSDQEDVIILANISSFQLRINIETLLELAPKVEDEIWFIQDIKNKSHTFTCVLNDIEIGKGIDEPFESWESYSNSISEWFKEGLDQSDQNRMAIILETKIMSERDKDKEKTMLLVDSEKSRYYIGFCTTFTLPRLIFGGVDGLYAGPEFFNFDALAYCRIKDLGPKKLDNKPIDVHAYFGVYFEVGIGNAVIHTVDKENVVFDPYTDIFMGLRFGAAVSFFVPRVEEGKYKDRLFGIGIETLVDLPILNYALSYDNAQKNNSEDPDHLLYKADYLCNWLITFLIHLFPNHRTKLDILLGLNLGFQRGFIINFDGTWTDYPAVNQLGLQIGARFKLDIYNFNKYKKTIY